MAATTHTTTMTMTSLSECSEKDVLREEVMWRQVEHHLEHHLAMWRRRLYHHLVARHKMKTMTILSFPSPVPVTSVLMRIH